MLLSLGGSDCMKLRLSRLQAQSTGGMRPDANENSEINPSTSFGLPELLGAIHISPLASRDAAKSLLSTLISDPTGECRFD